MGISIEGTIMFEGGYLLIHAYKPALESVPVTEVVHDIANMT